MIHFEIEFLICFSKPTVYKKPSSKKKPNKKSKPHKNVKPSIKSQGYENLNETHSNNVNHVNQLDCCHIEYCILDETLPVVEINVVTWGSGAKVFVEDYCESVNTTTIDNTVWINFTIAHKISDFQNDDIIKFKNSTITFTISHNQAKDMSDVNNDWEEQFRIIKIPVGPKNQQPKHFFGTVETSLTNNSVKHDLITRENNFKMSLPIRHSIESLLQALPLEKRTKIKIQEISAKLMNNDKPQERIDTGEKVKRNKNKSKSIKNETNLNLKSEFLIAETPNLCVEQIITESSSSIKFVAVYVSSSKILTDEQNMLFIPFIINIKSIEDLPLSFLEKLNVKTIYAQYEMAHILDSIETERFPLTGKNVFMNDTKVFFLSGPEENRHSRGLKPSLLQLQEALLTRRMVVKLFGKVNLEDPLFEACLFGNNPFDELISSPNHVKNETPSKQELMLLGSACFNLIPLLDGQTVLETSSVLISSPASTWDLMCDWKLLKEELLNREEQEALLEKFSFRGQIPDEVLLKTCCRFVISVYSPYPLSKLEGNDDFSLPNIYQRSVLIFHNQKLAYEAFKRIRSINDTHYKPEMALENTTMESLDIVNLQNQLCSPENIAGDLTVQKISFSVSKKIITGFFLDGKKECIMVLEGCSLIFSGTIEVLASMMSTNDGKIIYDSTLFFSRRQYGEFIPLLNIFYMQLKTPFNTLLKQTQHYLTKNLPDPSIQALLRLDMLRRSPTLNCIAVHQLFPSYEQLINFNLSFGVTVNGGDSHLVATL